MRSVSFISACSPSPQRRRLRSATSGTRAGNTTRVNSVEDTMPPITTVTSGHCTSVPAPTFSASVRRASNLPPRSKTQGDLGLVETSRGAAAERVLDIETGTQWGGGPNAAVSRSASNPSARTPNRRRSGWARVTRKGVVERKSLVWRSRRWRPCLYARRDREDSQCGQSQPHGNSLERRRRPATASACDRRTKRIAWRRLVALPFRETGLANL